MSGSEDDRDRRVWARRRFATMAGVMAVFLIALGLMLSRASGSAHDFGRASAAYGIGAGVISLLLTFGFDPRRED